MPLLRHEDIMLILVQNMSYWHMSFITLNGMLMNVGGIFHMFSSLYGYYLLPDDAKD